MPRPTTKADLLALSQKNFTKLNEFVDNFPEEQQNAEFPEGMLNRNIRDVLAHLHQWHLMVLDWYTVGMRGDKPDIPAKGYNWRTIPDLNREIQKKYSHTPLMEVRRLLNDSYTKIQDLIQSHSDEELFERQRYKWTGTNALGAYLVSATSSHYDWAFKLIKKATK
ncbi:ClbS/DfsB family four-helix bundle protein [Fulvivirga sp. M361]|uniref:ClbS/DfsB family four-helix bundle protein n=1 Tax=Fulvivirga sp. M361 TaxID=2594266 RepID=UPI00117A5D5F|nr:ClbS/DfsB family four-helix bundle protein [Fulvivirga sp. M361]TRX62746.1 ClbS/DfsB family four-helix bundle protein [Fulvivirga sp. M361]